MEKTKEIILINNFKTDYHICSGKDSDSCTRFAAKQLQKYLYESSDCCIPVFSDKCPRRSKEILVGLNVRNTKKDARLNSASSEAYVIKIEDGDIIIHGNSPRGTLYGVYRFLEEVVGFRCFTSDCEKVDKHNSIILKDIDIFQDFTFEYREVYFTDAFNGDFASKNMLNSNLADISADKGGKTKWFNFHHSFSDLISPDDYFDSHPEYFSEIDGVRRKEHTELCLSNADVFKLALKKVETWIKENPDCKIFSVAQDEWMGHFIKMACECDNCKKIDEENESQSGSVITFVNKIAKAISEKYPDILIHTFAYQYSRKPPKNVKPLDNVIVRLTNIECSWGNSIEETAKRDKEGNCAKFLNDLIGWSKITNRLYIWDYCVNFRNYLLPFPNFRTMGKNIELYRKSNIKGVLMQGNFSYGGGGYMDEMKSYVISHLLRDDHSDVKTLIKEFCDNYYGEASPYIQEYIYLWEDEVNGKELWLYDDADSNLFNSSNIEKASELINKALTYKTEKTQKRIEKVALGLEYLKLVRLPLDYERRNEKIEEFYEKVRSQRITELFERTALEYSIDIMKKSRYCKERNNWYSLYYIMR